MSRGAEAHVKRGTLPFVEGVAPPPDELIELLEADGAGEVGVQSCEEVRQGHLRTVVSKRAADDFAERVLVQLRALAQVTTRVERRDQVGTGESVMLSQDGLQRSLYASRVARHDRPPPTAVDVRSGVNRRRPSMLIPCMILGGDGADEGGQERLRLEIDGHPRRDALHDLGVRDRPPIIRVERVEELVREDGADAHLRAKLDKLLCVKAPAAVLIVSLEGPPQRVRAEL